MANTDLELRILFLATDIQALLFEKVIVAQLSDGYWENSAPFEHWKFWTAVTVVSAGPGSGGVPRLVVGGAASWRGPRCTRIKYGLERLLQFDPVREQMLAMVNQYNAAITSAHTPIYTVKELRADLKAIKLAMRNVVRE